MSRIEDGPRPTRAQSSEVEFSTPAGLDAALDHPALGVDDEPAARFEAAAGHARALAPAVQGKGLRPLPGPPTALDLAKLEWSRAVDAFREASKANPPQAGHRRPYTELDQADPLPDAVAAATTQLLDAAERLMAATGAKCERRGNELVLTPDASSALGAYARLLERVVDERVVLHPEVLWRDQAVGAHNTVARTVFLSLRAFEQQRPTQTERHEFLHALFNTWFHTHDGYSASNAWVNPPAGGAHFPPGRAYRYGFSVEEVLCAAYDVFDITRDLGPLRRRLLAGDAGALPALKELLEKLTWQQDKQAGRALADKLVELARGAAAALDDPAAEVTLELKPREGEDDAVDVHLAAPGVGLDLSFPTLAPKPDARRLVEGRLEDFVEVGEAYAAQDDALRAAREAVAAAVEAGELKALPALLLEAQRAARGLRAVISLGHGQPEPG